MVIGLLGRIISAHADNCLLYKRAYQDNIDTSVHAVILEDELTDIIGDLHVYQNQTYSVDCQIRSALTSISDIFYNQSYRGYSTVDDDFETTKNKVKTLDKDIHSLENSHLNSDFTNTEVLLEKLTAYLNTQLSKPKSYKTEFSLEQAQKDPTLQEIALAYKALSEESDAKRTALKTAGENEQARVEILQKEYEERQQTATIINWVVTGLCIVGSIAITVATCGAASPLAVALTVGAVSAGSGVIMAGTQSITSQWVETGDLSKTDWLDVGKCSLIAGVTGFVTGFVSAGVGGVVTSKLASAAVTAPLINSSSTVTRVATHVVIGSVSEVASGTVSRFAGGIISTGDVDESLKQAFDPKNMLFDAALGGATGGVQGLKKPQQNSVNLMSPEQTQQRELVSSIEDANNPLKLETNMQKGNYGEMKMDIEFESNGCKRISKNRVTGLDDATHHGIDGVYESSNPPPKYIIAEAKYGSSKLGNTKDGKQMSDIWIDNRLDDAVGKVKADEIRLESVLNPENVQTNLVNISKDGSVTNHLLDSYGNIKK